MLKGGVFGTNHNHEIKIAILLNFFFGELYLHYFTLKKLPFNRSLTDIFGGKYIIELELTRMYGKINLNLDQLLKKLNNSFPKKSGILGLGPASGIKFNEMREISIKAIDELRSIDESINIESIASNFLMICQSYDTKTINVFGNDFTDYMDEFLFRNAKNKLNKENVKEIFEALINPKPEYDNKELKFSTSNRFAKDIALMCGSKISLMEHILICTRELRDKKTEEKQEERERERDRHL